MRTMVGQEVAESQRRPMAPSYNALATIGMRAKRSDHGQPEREVARGVGRHLRLRRPQMRQRAQGAKRRSED
jgi:hypothetical protein